MDIIQLLQSQLKEGTLEQLAGQIGADKEQTSAAATGVFSALLNGINKNVATEDGANSFLSALDRDHDGSILDKFGDLLKGSAPVANPSTTNGAGILNHILGNNQNTIAEAISKMSGIDSGKAMKMLITLAPLVLGVMGKLKSNNEVGSGGLLDLITKTTQAQSAQPQGNIFTRLLDKDGDGSIMDDLLQMGTKTLGGLFKK